ncbi:MAG TPA: hypothetical protein VH326_04205 [Sphingomonas sp.]|nr:hypothetical protein [Sphingomonas sp.]
MARWPALRQKQRDFLREMIIIILGVLIALLINALADWIGWKYRVATTETRIANQMIRDQATLLDMVDWQHCTDAVLTDLDAVLIDARKNGRLPDIGVIERPDFRALTDATWQTTIDNNVAAHMTDDDAERYARYYAAIGKLTDTEWEFARQATVLDALIHAPGDIAVERIDAARSTIAQLRLLIQANSFKIHQAFSQMPPIDSSDSRATPKRCRPLMIDLKPYVKRD